MELCLVQKKESVLGRQYRRLGPVGWEGGDKTVDRFALIWFKRRDVDQSGHPGVGSSLGDDRTTVGMANQHDLTVLCIYNLTCRRDVARQCQSWVLHDADVVTVPPQE